MGITQIESRRFSRRVNAISGRRCQAVVRVRPEPLSEWCCYGDFLSHADVGRPTLVQNAIACFLAQDYPAGKRRLLILDDAGQIAPQGGAGWFVGSCRLAMKRSQLKYSQLNLLDAGWADAFVIWDDDEYLRSGRPNGRVLRKSGVSLLSILNSAGVVLASRPAQHD